MNHRSFRTVPAVLKQYAAPSAFGVLAILGGCKSSHSLPEFKPNPNAKERYEITVTVENAPGPFEVIRGGASYQAFDCSYVSNKLAGAIGKPEWGLLIDYRQTSGNTWVGTFHVDGMLDEDYDGPDGVMRPCHWQMTNVSAVLLATGAEGETEFISLLRVGDVLTGKSVTTYFWREGYPRDTVANYPDFGKEGAEIYSADIQGNLFSVTLSASKVIPFDDFESANVQRYVPKAQKDLFSMGLLTRNMK